ncbi:NrsF family protein, partial [Enterococcus faecium]
RPEARLRTGWALIPALLMAGGIAVELVRAGTGGWWQRLVGDQPVACFACVFLLSLPMLGGMLLALRRGAPARPRATGAMAGLA